MHPHPDGPAFGDIVYFNTDGGTYRSTDGGATVQNLCLVGLGVGQFYIRRSPGAGTPTGIPRWHAGPGLPGREQGALDGPGPSTSFTQVISGDYGHLSTHASGSLNACTPVPGFTLVVSGGLPSTQSADFPPGASHLWLPPVVADPTNYGLLLLRAAPVAPEQPQLDRDPALQHRLRRGSRRVPVRPGLLARGPATRLGGERRGTAVAVHGRRGHLDRVAPGHPGLALLLRQLPGPHPTDPLRVAASGSGYSTAGVRLSTDGGATWTGLTAGLPATMVYDVAWSVDAPDDLFAATEAGAYHYDASTQSWSNAMGSEAPATTYWSVERVPSGGLMRFGTYGRGIWDLVLDQEPPRSPATARPTSRTPPGPLADSS